MKKPLDFIASTAFTAFTTFTVFLILTFTLSSNAFSEPAKIYLGMYTKHISTSNLNEQNNLIGISKGGYTVAHFNNSFDYKSIAISYDFLGSNDFNDNCKFGSKAGIVSGYKALNKGGKGAIPFIAPWIECEWIGMILFGEAVMVYVWF